MIIFIASDIDHPISAHSTVLISAYFSLYTFN
nr:MAG TPA: apoptosis regulator [Caudoviricetes sp.]